MLAKCANPSCSSRFLYLRDGQLFRVEVIAENGPDVEQATCNPTEACRPFVVNGQKRVRVEHYWLCAACAAQMTLIFEPGKGIVPVPLQSHSQQAAAS